MSSARRFKSIEHSVADLFLKGEDGELDLRVEVERSGAVCLKVRLSTKTKFSQDCMNFASLMWRKWVFACLTI